MLSKGTFAGGNAAVIAAVPPLNHAAPAGKDELVEDELELVVVPVLELDVAVLLDELVELRTLDATDANELPELLPPPPQLLRPSTLMAEREPKVKMALRRVESISNEVLMASFGVGLF